MARFHVSQDETGYFQLTLENDAGELRLISYQAKTAEQLIERAIELVRSGEFGNALIVADVGSRSSAAAARATDGHANAAAAGERSWRPAPRKAGP
jgi:hypothetical protein